MERVDVGAIVDQKAAVKLTDGETFLLEDKKMIARIWHGVTEAGKADEYYQYLNETGIPDYRATKENRGVYVLRRVEADKAHFLLLTFWESIAAIEEFAGEDIERARYYPEDEKFLLELEPNVQHFDVLGED